MDQSQPGGHFSRGVGERLAEAREKQGLDLGDVAARTRVPLRHLEAIERGRHDDLPAIPYAAGFVRSYAALLGLDGAAFARDFRAELGGRAREDLAAPFEPADPARIPPRALVIAALLIAVLLVGGYALWRSGAFGGESADDRARLAAGTNAAPAPIPAPRARAAAPAAPAATGAAVLTATDPVWLRVRDRDVRLIEKVLAPGESWTVPATATAPELLTGRPQALKVMVGTTAIPPLGPPDRTVSGASLLPQSLLARLNPAAATTATVPSPAANAPERAAVAPPAVRPYPRRRSPARPEATPAPGPTVPASKSLPPAAPAAPPRTNQG